MRRQITDVVKTANHIGDKLYLWAFQLQVAPFNIPELVTENNKMESITGTHSDSLLST